MTSHHQPQQHRMLFMYAETPLHPGAAESVGTVDQPIQRSTVRLPIIQQPGVKGALKSYLRLRSQEDASWVNDLFGDDPPEPGATDPPAAGRLWPGEGMLVAFPVPTWRCGFAWVTSPLLLSQLARALRVTGMPEAVSLPGLGPAEGQAFAPVGSGWAPTTLLGDYEMHTTEQESVGGLAQWLASYALPTDDSFAYYRGKLGRDLLVVDDESMVDLTVEFSVKMTRVRLRPDQKTVAKGALWVEERLPRDSLLASPQITLDGSVDMGNFDKHLNPKGGAVMGIGGHGGYVWTRLLDRQSFDGASESVS